ncbi:MAG TPA: DUF4440 domain-containing protein [Pirellulales bacterium]|nr:DUF4440 domain-containing protein [Pirellulales bacterium]
MSDPTQEILVLSRRLLDSIVSGDWKSYEALCDPSITCYEPECLGHLVEGLAFHKYYFDLPGGGKSPVNTTICAPHVRFLGPDAAIVSYVRLTQKLGADGAPVSVRVTETRVWQRLDGNWRHVHFHRSPA